MGTDRHPSVEVEGAAGALRDLPADFGIVLVGDEPLIEAALAERKDLPRDRVEIIHAPQTIQPGESVAAVRRKRDSSIVVGLELQRSGYADAFISAGSTGAVMAASLFVLGRLGGVDRPAVAAPLPTAAQPCLLIDAGANIDCKPSHLLQFARLGSIYVEDAWQQAQPRVGLLNIGEEPEKGDERTVEAFRLLRASGLNFVGNVEGRDIIRGVCDVLVADGFVGNVLLKFYESVTAFFHGLVSERLTNLVPADAVNEIFRGFDYTDYGGAPLLGVDGISIICHGGSPPRAIRNAIRVARQAVITRMLKHLERAIAESAGTANV
jgi:glycerol-3-phosphate acyltransferase PlsX